MFTAHDPDEPAVPRRTSSGSSGAVQRSHPSAGSGEGTNGPIDAISALNARIAALTSAASTRTAERAVPVPDGDEAARAREIVLRQLAAGPRSRSTLAGKLAAREISEDVAGAVLDRYQQLGLIDDAAFAETYVRAKHRDRGLGRHALRAELRRKGVGAAEVNAAVAAIDDDDEYRRASELVAKRLASLTSAAPDVARRRLFGLLARRGYSPETAVRVIDQALADGAVSEA